MDRKHETTRESGRMQQHPTSGFCMSEAMTTNTTDANKNDASTDEPTETDVFADAPLDYEAIRGTRTYENVLYSKAHAKRTVPVNVLSEERTREIEGSVERAKEFVADDPRRVAVPQSTEAMIESQSAPYVSTVFYDGKVVRGKIVGEDEYGHPEYANDGYALEWTYRAAVRSDAYEVQLVDAEYETGNVTIRIERLDQREASATEGN